MMSTLHPSVLTGAIVLALGGAFGYHGLYLKGQQQLKQLEAELQQTKHLQVARERLSASLDQAERLRMRLAPEGEVDWLVREVGRIAREAGVTLSLIEPKRPQEIEGYTHLSVEVGFSSSYHDLGRFLGRLESVPHYLLVQHLDVARLQPQKSESSVRLMVSAFYAPPLLSKAHSP